MARASKKLTNAVLELMRLCIDSGVKLEFATPPDPENKRELYGEFYAEHLKIIIYKHRKDPITPVTVYTLAHEYRHARQYIELYQPSYWIFSVGATAKVRQDVLDEIERDADAYAVQFLTDRKIPVPKVMTEG